MDKELHDGDLELHEDGSLLGGGDGHSPGVGSDCKKWEENCLGGKRSSERVGKNPCVC